MGKTKQSLAIKDAISSEKNLTGKIPSTKAPRKPARKADLVYFHLEIYDDTSGDPDWPTIVEKLQAGKTYTAVITCEEQPSSINESARQRGMPIKGPLILALFYRSAGDVSIVNPIHPAYTKFNSEDPLGEKLECSFTVPSDFPSCQLSLELEIKHQYDKRPLLVTKYTISVKGQEPSPGQEIFSVSQIDERLPEKTAILLAQRTEHRQQVRLRGWSEVGKQLDDLASMNTVVSIEELQAYRQRKKAKKLRPDQILQLLHHFSRNNSPELLCWLNKLFASHEEQLNLIIVDLTDLEIPWEILQIEPDRYLGACARVVRWLPTQYFARKRALSVQPGSHAGPILSYLDARIGPALIQNEQDALELLAGKPYPSLAELRKRLLDSLEEIGLIYIGCHGIAGKHLGDGHLLQQNEPELSSIGLEGIYECKFPRLIVFLNACESARVIKKSPDDPSSFVDTFLAHCASGFIGTLAQVDVVTASTIAAFILRAALQPGGVQIAEKLRLLRKTEIERLKLNKTARTADYYRFIDTFMYVYYGNPLARLQLHPKEEDEE